MPDGGAIDLAAKPPGHAMRFAGPAFAASDCQTHLASEPPQSAPMRGPVWRAADQVRGDL